MTECSEEGAQPESSRRVRAAQPLRHPPPSAIPNVDATSLNFSVIQQ
jgi:hypothetical protein